MPDYNDYMFQFKDLSKSDKPLVLSRWNDPQKVFIPREFITDLKNYHIVAIDFLYQCYKKKLHGAILNEDLHLNCPLQVAVFINAIHTCVLDNCIVFIICSSDALVSWHYHLSDKAGLNVKILKPETKDEIIEAIPNLSGTAILLSFTDIKLGQEFTHFDFNFVIIDDMDLVYNKLLIKRLSGDFNIGITKINFYQNRDQRMQWTMLNWSNPGCVGKLNNFYEMDDDNFHNFRDNYRKWWLRLTWNFCDTFIKPSAEELKEYEEKLDRWATTIEALDYKKAKKRKIELVPDEESQIESPPTKIKKESAFPVKIKKESDSKTNGTSSNNILYENENTEMATEAFSRCLPFIPEEDINSNSSADTIIYDHTKETIKLENTEYVELSSMDELPIVSAIVKHFESSSEPITKTPPKFSLDEPNGSKYQPSCSNFFLSMIENRDLISDQNAASCSHTGRDRKDVSCEMLLEEVDEILKFSADSSLQTTSQKMYFSESFEEDNDSPVL